MGFSPANVYLVVGREAALIDSGVADDEAVAARLEYLKDMAPARPRYIIVSHAHRDHMGGARKLKEATGAEVLAHPLEFSAGSTVDRTVAEGDRLDIGGAELEVIHTPGHTPGHICLYLKPGGLLFSGDHILGLGTTVIAPPQGDMAQYIDSLRKLLTRDIQMICPGHGPLITAAKRKIQELIQHRLEREQQVLTCLERGKTRLDELVKEIYPELDPRLDGLAKSQTKAHLIKLEREGRVTSLAGEGRYWLRP